MSLPICFSLAIPGRVYARTEIIFRSDQPIGKKKKKKAHSSFYYSPGNKLSNNNRATEVVQKTSGMMSKALISMIDIWKTELHVGGNINVSLNFDL